MFWHFISKCRLGWTLPETRLFVESLSIDSNFLTWLLIRWQHDTQPIRSYVRNISLTAILAEKFIWRSPQKPDQMCHCHNSTSCSWPLCDQGRSRPLHNWYSMMTSSNGDIFRVTGHLCGKFTGPRWISHTKASDAELWCLLWSASK